MPILPVGGGGGLVTSCCAWTEFFLLLSKIHCIEQTWLKNMIFHENLITFANNYRTESFEKPRKNLRPVQAQKLHYKILPLPRGPSASAN